MLIAEPKVNFRPALWDNRIDSISVYPYFKHAIADLKVKYFTKLKSASNHKICWQLNCRSFRHDLSAALKCMFCSVVLIRWKATCKTAVLLIYHWGDVGIKIIWKRDPSEKENLQNKEKKQTSFYGGCSWELMESATILTPLAPA